MSTNWWLSHENVHTLLEWMAEQGSDAADIVHAHAKPWHYEDEYRKAQAVIDTEPLWRDNDA